MNTDEQEVTVRLLCSASLEALAGDDTCDFGLQDIAQELQVGTPQPDGTLCFTGSLRVKPARATQPARFYGTVVHGPTNDRFLYLSWKRRQPADTLWLRRLKIPLTDFPALTGGTTTITGHVTAPASGVRAGVVWSTE